MCVNMPCAYLVVGDVCWHGVSLCVKIFLFVDFI